MSAKYNDYHRFSTLKWTSMAVFFSIFLVRFGMTEIQVISIQVVYDITK